MSYTTLEHVRKHLGERAIGLQKITGEEIKLVGFAPARLEYLPVIENSEIVQIIQQLKPDYQLISFASNDQAILAHSPVVKNSVVLATDSSLGTIFIENVDYLVDHQNGIITRIPGGAIPSGGTTSAWCLPFRAYQKLVDYRIDYEKGEIARISGGAIPSGQCVYVDYQSDIAVIDDEIIGNAIEEANQQVLDFIDAEFAASTDRSLVIAETYLAISIVCRIKALKAADSGAKKEQASSWEILAEQYKKDGYMLLAKYGGKADSFAAPRRA